MTQQSTPPGNLQGHPHGRPTSAARPTGPKQPQASKRDSPREGSRREGAGPSGPPDPPARRFKGFRDTSREEMALHPGGKETLKENSDGETAGNDAPDDVAPKDIGSEDEAASDKGSCGSAPKEEGQADGEGSLEEKWKEVRRLYDDGPRREARHLAARLAIEERRFAAPPEASALYVYDPSAGVYSAGVYMDQGEEVLRRLLLRRLGTYHSRREVREIEEKVRALTSEKSFGRLKATPLANADLTVLDSDPGSLSVIEPDPGRRFLKRSRARWDPGASAPTFRELLRRAVPSEQDRQVLQDYAGYCLLRWTRPYRRVLLAAGPTGSGTGPFLHALSQILGWVSSVSPSRLARRGGTSKQLRGPWANVCSGIDPEALARLPLLRAFAAGGPGLESPEALQRQQAHPVPYRATKHVYAAEELPPLPAGDLFYERVLLVAFPRKLPAEDLVAEDKLKAERDGILQWAMEGLRRVRGSEAFPSGRGPTETRQRWDALSGPIGRLKAGLLKVTGDPQDLIRKEDLYSIYKEFCGQENIFAETKGTFTSTLTQDPRIEARKRVPTSGADQVPCYVGVRWREP